LMMRSSWSAPSWQVCSGEPKRFDGASFKQKMLTAHAWISAQSSRRA